VAKLIVALLLALLALAMGFLPAAYAQQHTFGFTAPPVTSGGGTIDISSGIVSGSGTFGHFVHDTLPFSVSFAFTSVSSFSSGPPTTVTLNGVVTASDTAKIPVDSEVQVILSEGLIGGSDCGCNIILRFAGGLTSAFSGRLMIH
jgi:hypothetical protein